jgi:pyruvate kinase
MIRRTKIVCTIGPASEKERVLREIVRAGMDVARINFSHGNHVTHAFNIALIRRLAQEEGRVLAILGDLQGPKLRIGEIAGGKALLRPGKELSLTTRPVPGDAILVNLPHPELVRDVRPGDRILLDDGLLELEALETTETDIRCRVITGGYLGSHKGVSVPGGHLSLPALTAKDYQNVAFAIEQKVDYLALSFVRRATDLMELKDLLAEKEAHIPVVAKIEKREALEAFDDILAASDGVMVARGDLGIEIPAEEVPIHQKQIIHKANRVGLPVITATQMLDSMIRNPRPTRAEASDVANAILDGTDAIMLSGETAIGKYPVEAVRTMDRIARTTEQAIPYGEWTQKAVMAPSFTPTDAISQATCEIALELSAKIIITSTTSGYTARMVAKHRPVIPIIAVTPNLDTRQRLALVWGVQPFMVESFVDTDQMIATTVKKALAEGLVQSGDTVIITAGVPLGTPGRTNMLKIEVIP